jgi:oligo-1,6-glucosidase
MIPEWRWWKETVVYEIFLRSFKDSDGNGTGDLRGVLEKLDYLKGLGVGALWLTPFFPSPLHDAGYDVSDYDGVHPEFGTMADFDELVEEAHKRGLKLILDLVLNHTSDEHPWFKESRRSREDPKRGYYIWRPPGKDGREPNNWMSLVGGSAWEFDPASGEYYLHLFSKYQPDLDWTHPEVKKGTFAMIRRWLERGADGFRLDVINLLMKAPGLPDGVYREGYGKKDGRYVLDYPLYANNPGMHELLQELRRDVLDPYGAATVGEVHFTPSSEAWKYVDPRRKELDMVVQVDILFDRSGPKFVKDRVKEWFLSFQGRGWNTMALGNHDTPRMLSALGNDGPYRDLSAKALAVHILTSPGTPFLYQGDELGMANVEFASMDEYRDIEMRRFYEDLLRQGKTPAEAFAYLRPRSRDNARTPMQWTAGENAGFTTGVPWIGLNPDYRTINAEAQDRDPGSVLNFYRRMLALRRESPALVHGSFYPLMEEDCRVVAYRRLWEGRGFLILVNESEHVAPLEAALVGKGSLALGNYPDLPHEWAARLRPWEARILAEG